MRARGPPGLSRERSGVREGSAGAARPGDGACLAPRTDREADRLTELHDRLIERPGRAAVEQPGERVREAALYSGRANVARLAGPPCGDADPVRFERDRRCLEGDRGDRARDVRSHARQRLEALDRGGEAPSMIGDERAGRLVHVAGPSVVAGTLPDLEDGAEAAGGEGRDVREPLEEPFVVRDRLGDPGLLEEDLGEPDVVRLVVASPRERTGRGREPLKEPRYKIGRGVGRVRGFGASGHGRRGGGRTRDLKRGRRSNGGGSPHERTSPSDPRHRLHVRAGRGPLPAPGRGRLLRGVVRALPGVRSPPSGARPETGGPRAVRGRERR